MRMHPYRRSALFGLVIGLIFGSVFYAVMRLTGHHANGYLLVAIVGLSIPGSILISMTTESAAVDGRDWERHDPAHIPKDSHADAPLEGAEQADHERRGDDAPLPAPAKR
jgi:hypothetical protein